MIKIKYLFLIFCMCLCIPSKSQSLVNVIRKPSKIDFYAVKKSILEGFLRDTNYVIIIILPDLL